MTNKSNSFRLFFLKLAAFFCIVFIADFIIGNSLKKFYFKQQTGYDYLTTYAIEKTKAEFLIFGSSRAVSIFNCDIFEDQIDFSCYNVGRDGEPIFYHYGILKAVLKRYTPKIIILSFDAGNFSKKADDYDKLSVLLPYYESHPEIRPIVELKGRYEKLKLLSKIYSYNSLLLPIVAGNIAFNQKKYYNSNGYIPIYKFFSGPLQTFDYTNEGELDSVKVNTYKHFIQDCIKSNIQLYIVCPPYMINQIGIPPSITTAKKIAREYNIDFFDYSKDEFYTTKPQLFADYRHLNPQGVTIFSNAIIEKINYKTQLLKENKY